MNAISALQDTLKNEMELFRSRLSSIAIVDIGTIVSINEKGRAVVHGSSFIGGEQVKYQDAEIIYPGNTNGTYGAAVTGSACLIFFPCSCMLDTVTKNVRFTAMPFDKAGIKVMPIGNGAQDTVHLDRTNTGSISIATENYSATADPECVNVETNDGAASVSLNKQGIHVIKQGNSSTYYRDLVDGTATTEWLSKNKDVKWTDTLNSDGSRTFVQNDPRNQEGDPFLKLEIAPDGKVSIETAKNVEVEVKGDADIKADGDIHVDGENIELNGNNKRLVTYAELKQAMDLLWVAMTTTPIVGNGSPQPTWTGLDPVRGIDISASETQTIKTGG